jgi:rhamnulokinase
MNMRRALDDLVRITGDPIQRITIIGGGTNSGLLCQAIADATNRPVLAGPAEATAIGNLLIQSVTNGYCADLQEARTSTGHHNRSLRFEPATDRQAWEAAYRRFTET